MNARQKRFCHEYLVDLNGTQAMRRAGFTGTDASLATMAGRLLKKVEVKALINEGKARQQKRTEITADDVKRKLMAVAFGDPRKLVEHRRRCCRCCWGKDHLYQRTDRELELSRQGHEERVRKYQDGGGAIDDDDDQDPGEFDEQGGGGFDFTRMPHDRCTECRGEGKVEVFIHDTDTLDEDALALYAGCKHTKDGIEISLASQERARELLAKHFGLLNTKVEVTGKVTLEQLLSESWKKPEEGVKP